MDSLIRTKLENIESPFAEFAAANLRRTTKLTFSPPTEPVAVTASRTGNTAAVTPNHPWPVDSAGNPMQHLAQLNLAELPAREELPAEGLLQFFVAVDDHMGTTNGADPNYRGSVVRYIPAAELETAAAETHDHPKSIFTIDQFRITGTLYDQAPQCDDYQFSAVAEQAGIYTEEEDFLDSIGFYDDEDFEDLDEEDALEEYGWLDPVDALEDVTDHYAQLFLGGWTQHPQQDPRNYLHDENSRYFNPHFHTQDMQLLLQLASATGIDIGRDGILHFFIGDKDLANLDFSTPLYSFSAH